MMFGPFLIIGMIKNQKMMIFKKKCLDFFLSNHNVPFELEILSMYFAV